MLNHKRTKFLLLGSVSQVVSKVLFFILSYLVTAITFRYFSLEEFGLWAIITSLVVFTSNLDFGAGQALRNRLAQLSVKDNSEGKDYFFSVFYIFISVTVVLIILVYVARFCVPVTVLIRSDNIEILKIANFLVPFVLAILLLNVPFSFNSIGFLSYQEAHWTSAFEILRGLSGFLVVSAAILLKTRFSLIVVFYFLSIFFTSIISFYSFLKTRQWKPVVIGAKFCIEKIKSLIRQGVLFGVLQISGIIVTHTDTLIAGKVFGLEDAGEYNVVLKLFMILNVIHIAILTPLWSAFTEAVESKDYLWVSKTFLCSTVFTLLFFLFGISGLLVFAKKISYFWVGKEVGSSSLYVIMSIWSLLYGWKSCFSIFLAGTGNIKIQTLLDCAAALFIIPLSVFLGHKMGIIGICLAKVIVTVPVAISNPIQCLVILNRYRNDARYMCVKS